MRFSLLRCLPLLALLALAGQPADAAIELITNGDFETGDLTGWSMLNLGGGGGFFADKDDRAPLNSAYTVGPAAGTWYAVSSQSGGGVRVLSQEFTLPSPASSLILSFDMFVNNWTIDIVNPAGLTDSAGLNQHARVDILSGSATATDTGAGVLSNLYLGSDTGTDPNPFTHYSIDLTGIAGAAGTYRLRFAEADSLYFLNVGVDNVSLLYTPAPTVPEPAAALLLLTGVVGWGLRRRR